MKKNTIKTTVLIALVGGLFSLSSSSVLAVVEETPQITASPTPTPTKNVRSGSLATMREQNLAKAKEIVQNLITKQYITRLEALKARVQSNTKIGEDLKTTIVQKLDEEIAWFTSQKESILTATTLERVKTLSLEARMRFAKISGDVKRLYISGGYVVSLERVVKNTEEHTIPRIEATLTRLEEKGLDITTAKAQLANLKTEIASAKALISQIRNSTTQEQATELFDQAKDHLKEIKNILKEMVVGLREQAKSL